MSIDNFTIIKSILEFKSEDDFYLLQILQRKKDSNGRNVNGTNNNSRLIKAYYIDSLDHFDSIQTEIIQFCEIFGARAGISLNKRSFEEIALQHLKRVTNQVLDIDELYVIHDSSDKNYKQDGKTTRLADIYIQSLFNCGKVYVQDHDLIREASEKLFDTIIERLIREHNLSYPDTLKIYRGSLLLKLNK